MQSSEVPGYTAHWESGGSYVWLHKAKDTLRHLAQKSNRTSRLFWWKETWIQLNQFQMDSCKYINFKWNLNTLIINLFKSIFTSTKTATKTGFVLILQSMKYVIYISKYVHYHLSGSDGRFKRDPVWLWFYHKDEGA